VRTVTIYSVLAITPGLDRVAAESRAAVRTVVSAEFNGCVAFHSDRDLRLAGSGDVGGAGRALAQESTRTVGRGEVQTCIARRQRDATVARAAVSLVFQTEIQRGVTRVAERDLRLAGSVG
jgi:hypothetical protein